MKPETLAPDSPERLALMVAADEAILFLNDHPALHRGGGTFFDHNFTFWISHLDVNGKVKDSYEKPGEVEVKLRHGDERYKEFFDKYKDEDDDIDDPDCWVFVPYEEFYGYEWTHHHSLYRGEYMIVKYDGKESDEVIQYRNWSNYDGGSVESPTVEGLLVAIAKEVKADYGDFNSQSFLTKAEKENHEEERRLILDRSKKDDIPFSSMKDNPAYIEVTEGQLNLRWWDWYKKTEHHKTNWAWDV